MLLCKSSKIIQYQPELKLDVACPLTCHVKSFSFDIVGYSSSIKESLYIRNFHYCNFNYYHQIISLIKKTFIFFYFNHWVFSTSFNSNSIQKLNNFVFISFFINELCRIRISFKLNFSALTCMCEWMSICISICLSICHTVFKKCYPMSYLPIVNMCILRSAYVYKCVWTGTNTHAS